MIRPHRIVRSVAGILILGFSGAACSPRSTMQASGEAKPANAFMRTVASGQPNVKRIEVDTQGQSNILVHVVRLRQAVTVADVRNAMRDRTGLSYDSAHGTQVEYSSADGKVYLWYPGNQVVLSGEWKADPFFVEYVENGKVLRRVDDAKVCFRYGAETHNPVTGHSGSGWECTRFEAFKDTRLQTVSGDTFGLHTRKDVPFILTRDRMDLDALRSRIGS